MVIKVKVKLHSSYHLFQPNSGKIVHKMEKTQIPRILSMAPLFVMGLADNPCNMK